MTDRDARPARRTAGFTLIEIMITVAILGVLAAIAISEYRRYTLRSYEPERETTMKLIRDSVMEYYGTYGRFPTTATGGNPSSINCPLNPPAGLDGLKHEWVPGVGNWPDIAVGDKGLYRYQYSVIGNINAVGTGNLTITAQADNDQDGQTDFKIWSWIIAGGAGGGWAYTEFDDLQEW